MQKRTTSEKMTNAIKKNYLLQQQQNDTATTETKGQI